MTDPATRPPADLANRAPAGELGYAAALAELEAILAELERDAVDVDRLSEQVARRMRLSEKEVNDIRVAALLMDMENLEITARVIKKAVGELEDYDGAQHTFHGTELVQSLGCVLTGAFPLLLTQSESGELSTDKMPFGARIIRTVRAFDHLIHSVFGGAAISKN